MLVQGYRALRGATVIRAPMHTSTTGPSDPIQYPVTTSDGNVRTTNSGETNSKVGKVADNSMKSSVVNTWSKENFFRTEKLVNLGTKREEAIRNFLMQCPDAEREDLVKQLDNELASIDKEIEVLNQEMSASTITNKVTVQTATPSTVAVTSSAVAKKTDQVKTRTAQEIHKDNAAKLGIEADWIKESKGAKEDFQNTISEMVDTLAEELMGNVGNVLPAGAGKNIDNVLKAMERGLYDKLSNLQFETAGSLISSLLEATFELPLKENVVLPLIDSFVKTLEKKTGKEISEISNYKVQMMWETLIELVFDENIHSIMNDKMKKMVGNTIANNPITKEILGEMHGLVKAKVIKHFEDQGRKIEDVAASKLSRLLIKLILSTLLGMTQLDGIALNAKDLLKGSEEKNSAAEILAKSKDLLDYIGLVETNSLSARISRFMHSVVQNTYLHLHREELSLTKDLLLNRVSIDAVNTKLRESRLQAMTTFRNTIKNTFKDAVTQEDSQRRDVTLNSGEQLIASFNPFAPNARLEEGLLDDVRNNLHSAYQTGSSFYLNQSANQYQDDMTRIMSLNARRDYYADRFRA